MAVNNKNEIVVTDFHNHSVKVSVFLSSMTAVPTSFPLSQDSSLSHIFPLLEVIHWNNKHLWHGYFVLGTMLEAGDTVMNKANTLSFC